MLQPKNPLAHVVRGDDEWEAGPAPYGYVRVVGEPVPNWQPGGDINPAGSLMTWSFVGPRPMSSEYWSGETDAGGRLAGIAPHPTDPNISYIATASGGLWKTTNGGTNWNPITDALSILNCGWITIDPSNHNTIYLGTGEYVQGSTGDGIFRSTDAGANWTRIATAAQVGNQISKIYVHPTNPQIIHATSTSGYYRSTDGGATWSQRISGNCSSMALDPTNPNNVYIGRRSTGIYKSTDGGTTTTLLTGGLPTASFTYISLTLCDSSPGTLYAAFCASSGGGFSASTKPPTVAQRGRRRPPPPTSLHLRAVTTISTIRGTVCVSRNHDSRVILAVLLSSCDGEVDV